MVQTDVAPRSSPLIMPIAATPITARRKIANYTRGIWRRISAVRLHGSASTPAEADHPRSRCHHPLHRHQEGFFHDCYDCYCYLPLYICCGPHLVVSKLRRADIGAVEGRRASV